MDSDGLQKMQHICDFFDEFETFLEDAKRDMKPILDAVYEHYQANADDMDSRGHGLMLGMALKHDAGHHWSLFEVANALQYAKDYMEVCDGC